jgi:polyhydroxyalkanoate synthesis repressor PhaR
MSRLIKKYKNRRLYDTEISQYITIDDLHQYVMDGLEFHVEDSNNGKDLTNATLLQILTEMDTEASKFLSPEILRQLIKLSHHPMSKMLRGMMEETMKAMEVQIHNNPYVQDFKPASDTWDKQMKQFMSDWENLFRK